MEKTKILIVDDEKSICKVLSDNLEKYGYKPFTASDGKEALDIFQSEENIEAIISDIYMPNMDGFELLKKIKSLNKYTSVIIVTGKNSNLLDVINRGGDDFINKPIEMKYIDARIQLALQKNRALKKVAELSIIDQLTGIYNKRKFDKDLTSYIDQFKRYGHSMALMMTDVDNFKFINDNFGHAEGDNVLIDVANTLDSNIRTVDSAYRIGGDEFAIIYRMLNYDQAINASNRIKDFTANYTIKKRKSIITNKDSLAGVSLSIGLCNYKDGMNKDYLCRMADKMLYKSKINGRNEVNFIKS